MISVKIKVTRKKGPGSGHWGHKGRPGFVGGSKGGPGSNGGPGSGYHGHAGIPGHQGGSAPSGGSASTIIQTQTYDVDEDGILKGYTEGWERQGVSNARVNVVAKQLAASTGIAEYPVYSALGMWSATSNDNEPIALALQEAVSEEFGVPTSKFQARAIQRWKNGKLGKGVLDHTRRMTREEERKLVRQMYEDTQEKLKAAGVEHIRLYRGIRNTKPATGNVGDNISLESNAMQSWSSNRDMAAKFSRNDYKTARSGTQSGYVIEIVVPISRILSIPSTGFGMTFQDEFVLLGSKTGYDDVKLIDISRE